MQWQAGRVYGDWFEVILASLATLHSEEVLRQFLSIDVVGDPYEHMDNEPWLLDETELLNNYVCLLVELASARSWSQIMFTNNMPLAFAGASHSSPAVADQLLKHQRRIWESILKAETAVSDPSISRSIRTELKKRLEDISWNQLQVSREVFLQCAKSNWDPSDHNVLQLCHRLFAVPCNTKCDLEDLFAHLVSVAKLSSLATPMSKPLIG